MGDYRGQKLLNEAQKNLAEGSIKIFIWMKDYLIGGRR